MNVDVHDFAGDVQTTKIAKLAVNFASIMFEKRIPIFVQFSRDKLRVIDQWLTRPPVEEDCFG